MNGAYNFYEIMQDSEALNAYTTLLRVFKCVLLRKCSIHWAVSTGSSSWLVGAALPPEVEVCRAFCGFS
jgi:hypothetical protein